MIVAGGRNVVDEDTTEMDTTEILTVGETGWRMAGSLPHSLYAGRMRPSNNVVYYIGTVQ